MGAAKIDVKYVSELARLELTEEEMAVFQPQLENIVKYVEKISAVDVDGVEPMINGNTIVNRFREDSAKGRKNVLAHGRNLIFKGRAFFTKPNQLFI